jgi:hypothetical protein
MTTYSLFRNPVTGAIANGVRRDVDGAVIPADPANADWRDYQEWLAAGNAPSPAVNNPIPTEVDARL